MTKTSRQGQKYDTDGLGSDVIISVNTHSGLRPEVFAEDLLRRSGLDPALPELPPGFADARWFESRPGVLVLSTSALSVS